MTFDFEKLRFFIDSVPLNLDKKKNKEPINKKLREEITIRDNYICQCCGLSGEYGSNAYETNGKLHIHHIIPNGEASLKNCITLCKYCHIIIHMILYITKRWRYVLPR